MRSVWAIGLVALAAVPFAIADEREEAEEARRRRGRQNLEEILEGLEHGMHALDALGRERELKMLRRIAHEVRERIEKRDHDDPERAMVKRQLRALRMAFDLFHDSDSDKMRRLAEMVEHSIHARELALEGRRDREAREIRERAPSQGNVIEVLTYAADLLAKQGREERAEIVRRVAKEMHGHWEKRRARDKRREGGIEERVVRLERTVARLAEIVERLVDELEEDEDDEDR